MKIVRLGATSLAVSLVLTGCPLLNVADPESARGRGARDHDPYLGSQSGEIRLSLQMFRECAILATGEPLAGNSATPDYPAACADLRFPDLMELPPETSLNLLIGTRYFLNQFTWMDQAINTHTDPADPSAALAWIVGESALKDLDWSNVGVNLNEFRPVSEELPLWTREVLFGGANWMTQRDDTFTVEVVGASGSVVARPAEPYRRADYLAENATSGHTRVSWRIEGMLQPTFPGDQQIHNPPEFPPTFRTVARADFVNTGNPFNSFELPTGVVQPGPGFIRVTWSKVPSRPFIFPVNFILPENVGPTCFQGSNPSQPTPCGFGLAPDVKFSQPDGRNHFLPGETFSMYIQIQDNDGNLLHAPEELPSFNQFLTNNSNGISYFYPYSAAENMMESDLFSAFKIIGPLHNLKSHANVSTPIPNTGQFPPQFGGEESLQPLVPGLAASGAPGLADVKWPTRHLVQVAPDSPPGTYVALLMVSRQFLGERVTKTTAVPFQVGQDEPTTYPGNVGNCQICHRGVFSLENVRHGLGVDHVESCKSCHSSILSTFYRNVHRLHMGSDKYPLARNDCTVCHLTRDTPTRPSIEACSACHGDGLHGGRYFNEEFTTDGVANRYGNCAESCHRVHPPAAHILPPE